MKLQSSKIMMFVLIGVLFLSVSSVYAEIIVLKSGKSVEGKLIEKTDKYIKIDFEGVPLTYFFDEIDTINGQKIGTLPSSTPLDEAALNNSSEITVNKITSQEAEPTNSKQQLLDFKLGVNNVGENKIEFKFPPGMDTLYLFDTMNNKWNNLTGQKAKLVVNLYDKNRKLIYSSESVCVDSNKGFFGSIAFSDITKDKVGNVVYFSVSTQSCTEPTYVKLGNDKPEEVFAKKVVSAIRQGKEAYLTLYSNTPTSGAKMQEQEQAFSLLQGLLSEGGQIISIKPMKVQDADKYKNICSEHFDLNIGTIEEKHNTGGGVNEEGSFQVSIPIGKVNGEWKILYVE